MHSFIFYRSAWTPSVLLGSAFFISIVQQALRETFKFQHLLIFLLLGYNRNFFLDSDLEKQKVD